MVAEYKYKEDGNMAKLTNEQLAEIRQRAEAATPGPWLETDGGYVIDSDSEIVIAECESEINATFIAECHTDVPALLDMITELQAEVERKKEAEHLLSNAYDMLDDVHCYDTDLYREITRYLYGEDGDE